ncbi:hypothetical protein G5B38_01400 [Pseudohalocynthiibacter aestuariivivens]|nr:hypothetical protein [Pseudohalocynthiibacter aestuariivivens]QIE44295.1 hypothetical protein G5B38_01400 [Pseudohalocynthiibacter aestuariivivens]
MINKFALGFAAVAACAVAGVDYISQAQALGKGPGEYSMTDYTQSVSTRVGALVGTPPETPKVLAKTYLPEAPNGWTRRSWSPEDTGVFGDADMVGLKATLLSKFNESTAMTAAKSMMAGKENARAERDVWEYVGATGTIRLSATHNPSTGRIFAEKLENDPARANVMLRQSGRPIIMGEIAGVTFYASKRDEFDSSGNLPIFARGYIGDDIAITAYADGNHETLLDLLLAIDYDALNAMQEKPASGIGSDARPISAKKRAIFLTRAAQLEKAAAETANRVAKATNETKEIAAKRLERQGKEGGLFTSLDQSSDDKSDEAKSGAKRLQLNSDTCRTSSVGKFCGTD